MPPKNLEPPLEKCYKCGAVGHIGSECTAALSMPVPPELAEEKVDILPGGSVLREVYGDLMASPDSLCHCVSECMAMGAGIAVLFKQGFGRVDELKAQNVKTGGVAILDVTAKDATQPRIAYYLVTKPRFFHKPTYGTLSSSMAAMFTHMASVGITKLSMPELGCGLDGLEWPKVRAMVCDMIAGKGFDVTVYHFKPAVKLQGRRGNFAAKK